MTDFSLLLVDVQALLRACALHAEAEVVSQRLEAALADRGFNAHTRSNNRFEQLQNKSEVLEICFDLLKSTCSSHLEHGVAPLQQALWGRTLAITKEYSQLDQQQRQQLESLTGRYQGLRQEHQVLRSNLRSLKLTVQQLLSDVSTLLQHTASARQQQQQAQPQQHTETSSWAKQSDFQQHLQRAGFTAQHDAGSCNSALTDTHRGANGGRRCVSADGSAPAPGAGGAGADSHASLIALTMQRLIASIERMSRHFADCQAGKLIEDYSSSDPASAAEAGAASAPFAATTAAVGGSLSAAALAGTVSNRSSTAVTDSTQAAGLGGARTRSSSPTASSSGNYNDQGANLDIITGASRPRSSSSNGSAVGYSQHRPRNSTMRQVPRPPSSGSSGGGSGRPGLRNPVLGGVAAAAAAISSAMANASVPKAASTRPGAHRNLPSGTTSGQQGVSMSEQQQWQQQHGALQAVGLQAVKTDDAMRLSYDSEQAKAAADAWFADKARSSSSMQDSAAPASDNKEHMPAGAGTGGNVAGADVRNSSSQRAASLNMQQLAGIDCGGFSGCSSSTRQVRVAAGAPSTGSGQQQQVASSAAVAAARAPAASALPTGTRYQPDVTSLAREASSGSSTSNQSSLGPSISEVWQASREHSDQGTNGAAPDAVPCAGKARRAAACSRYPQQQQPQPGGRSPARLPPQGPSTRRPSRPSAAANAAAAAATAPGTAASVTSSGGSASMWGSGCSQTKPAGRQHGALTATQGAPSGPLTAALHSSAARRQANTTTSSSSDRRLSASVGGPLSSQRSGQGLGVQRPGSEGSSWATAGNSRSASSCSYRSVGSSGYSSSTRSNSCNLQRPPAGGADDGYDRKGAKASGGYTSSNSSSPNSDAMLAGSRASSAANSPAAKSVGSLPGSHACAAPTAAPAYGRLRRPPGSSEPMRTVQASVGSGQQQQQHVGRSGVSGGPKAVRSLDWSGPTQGQQVAADSAVQAGCMLRSQAAGRPISVQLPPRAPTGPCYQASQSVTDTGEQHNSSADAQGQPWQAAAAVTDQQQAQLQPTQHQLQVQPVVPCVLDSRAHVRLLSPIIEEASCQTTPRTSATDADAERSVRRGAFSSSGSSKARGLGCVAVRLCISDDGTAAAGAPAQHSSKLSGAAAAQLLQHGVAEGEAVGGEAPDALKQAEGRGGSPMLVRTGSISPPDTAVGKDTAVPAPNSSSTPWRAKQGADKQQQQPGHADAQQGRTSEQAQCEITAEPDASAQVDPVGASDTDSSAWAVQHAAAAAAAQGSASKAAKQAQRQRRSRDGDNSSSAQLLAAFPLGLGPLSHSLDSLDTLLTEGTTSGCLSDEDHCAGPLGNGGRDRLALEAAGEGNEGVDGVSVPLFCGPVRAAGCMLDLQDLLAIVLDVMNDKQAADKRYMASGLPQPTLGCHLQCYVAAKVHSKQAAYSSAMSAILTGLEQHKQVQPEIAVFCRVLSDELDEDYFQQRHLRLRQQLQHLATQAALSSTVRPQEQQQQQQSDLWEDCCSILLQQEQLRGMLEGWAAERAKLLQLPQGWPLQAQEVQELAASWELDIRQHCGTGPGESVRAGSAVAALLLWELDQQLQHLRPIADAFRAADVRCQGVLDLAQFQVFCRCLNQAMSDEEVQVLFTQELRVQGHEQVTFSAICRALLPAM